RPQGGASAFELRGGDEGRQSGRGGLVGGDLPQSQGSLHQGPTCRFVRHHRRASRRSSNLKWGGAGSELGAVAAPAAHSAGCGAGPATTLPVGASLPPITRRIAT